MNQPREEVGSQYIPKSSLTKEPTKRRNEFMIKEFKEFTNLPREEMISQIR